MSLNNTQLAQAYQLACIAELEALKPGNVHIFSDGHGMQVKEFIASAQVSAEIIAQPNLVLGERVFYSVEATWNAVKCNTNLGIILLCAPIIQAVMISNKLFKVGLLHDKFLEKNKENLNLRGTLQKVLQTTTVKDAQWVFDAIKLAKPAGLGASKSHDVLKAAQCDLYEAMYAAQDRDFIAMQYTHYFDDIFDVGLQEYEAALLLWQNSTWATTATYLFWMANYADSHVSRKHGVAVAFALQDEAAEHLNTFLMQSNPKHYQRTLLDFDQSLKARGINPGTSADLTVATWLLRYILTNS